MAYSVDVRLSKKKI